MERPLRPLTLGEILDRTAQLYRENFLLFTGIAAVYSGMLLVLSLAQIGVGETLRVEHAEHSLRWVIWLTACVTAVVAFIFAGAAVAANNRAVGWLHLGQRATIRGAYASILPQIGRYLWLMTITAVMVWLPFGVLYGAYLGVVLLYAGPKGLIGRPGVPVTSMDSHALMVFLATTGVFLVLLIPVVVYTTIMALRYSLAVPVCVMEDVKARKSIRRSIELSKGARGRIFLLFLLVAAVDIGLVMITQMFFIIAVMKHHGDLPVWIRVAQQVVAFFTNTFVGPILATGLTLFYYDQRVRKEGFDIERMMRAAGLEPEPEPEPTLVLSAGVGALPAAATQAAPPQTLDEEPETGLGSVHE
ncbi:MAG: glycerophosphoryl diester phosphodiesterase membrane domain-containing protein [Terracidiphilus sp.]